MFSLTVDDWWVLSTGVLVGVSCALIGVILVLRKLSMLGDAISHSVLFGLVVAFLVSQSRSAIVMFIGAVLTGLGTAFITDELNRRGKLQKDASIGVTFTVLFAIGVILISVFAGQVDLDQQCVLYGEIAFTPFDRLYLFGKDWGPRAFWSLLAVTIANIIFVFAGRKNLKLLSFDPVLASTLGINTVFWHYLLMTFVSITTVAAFESVGAILVIAFLVVPASTAYLIAKSFNAMLLMAMVFAALSAIFGYFMAVYFDASVSASMAIVSGILFIIVFLFSALGSIVLRRKAIEPEPVSS